MPKKTKSTKSKVKSKNFLQRFSSKNWKINLLGFFIASIPLLGVPSSFPLRPLPDLLLLGILFSWIYVSLKKRSSGFSASAIDWGIWAMLVFNIASGLGAIQSDLWLGNVIGFAVGILFYYIFRFYLGSSKNIEVLISGSLYSLVIVLLIGIWQLLMFLQVLPQWHAFEWLWSAGRLPRISATFIDALNYAAFLAIVFPWLLIRSLTEKKPIWQWVWRVVMVLFIVNALLTQGRALLAATVVTTVAVAYLLKSYWRPLFYWALVLIFAFSVMKPSVLGHLHPGFLKTQTNLGQGYDNAYFNKVGYGTSDRSQMARDAVKFVLQHPLGIGGGNSARVLSEKFQKEWGKGTPGPHNIFLGFFVELGVWGGLYFAVFILWLLYRLFDLNDLKNKKKFVLTPAIISRVSVFGALLGFMVYHQFVDSYAITPNVFYFWILLAMASRNLEV